MDRMDDVPHVHINFWAGEWGSGYDGPFLCLKSFLRRRIKGIKVTGRKVHDPKFEFIFEVLNGKTGQVYYDGQRVWRSKANLATDNEFSLNCLVDYIADSLETGATA